MNISAVVQARMGSTRLPGKVMLKLSNKPILEHIVKRLELCNSFKKIIIATSTDKKDDIIFKFCKDKNYSVYRGSKFDLLDRYYHVAKKYNLDGIIRITADCPVIDPLIVDRIVNYFKENNIDLCGLDGDFPDGLDCYIMSFKALKIAWEKAKLKSDREHVGPYIIRNKNKFKIKKMYIFKNLSHHRWTIDRPEDYKLLSIIYECLYDEKKPFFTSDILNLISKKPELLKINNHIIRNENYIKNEYEK